ncbi:bile acid:sodium symporter family protein [Pelomonas sp. KK5]|uniref:bile acid:sodium symporter family protein n=1 Tax=Pelomonas sp. KK5 TaxID=1855730 RepID=UPI00097C7B60|nr:bile acid:sodium symporter family protein [Pelomonas sp. KK5]
MLSLLAAIAAASAFPALGRSGGLLHLDLLSHAGVALIFFLTGLGLSTHELRHGLSRWRVHLLVQLCTFGLFPLLWCGLDALLGRWLAPDLALGFAYLCALPSTISSSVAMTAIARGNVPAAIFNATLSSLLGIVATPALLVAMVGAGGHVSLDIGGTILSLGRLLLLPLVLGQLLRPVMLKWHHRYKRYTTLIDRWVILMLVFAAFCDSVEGGLWRDHGAGLLLAGVAGAALLLGLVLALSTWAARRIGLGAEDEIAAVFCGSKKSMASGVPMAKLLFGAHPALGVIVLPVMFYHQLQLVACTVMAGRYARRT